MAFASSLLFHCAITDVPRLNSNRPTRCLPPSKSQEPRASLREDSAVTWRPRHLQCVTSSIQPCALRVGDFAATHFPADFRAQALLGSRAHGSSKNRTAYLDIYQRAFAVSYGRITSVRLATMANSTSSEIVGINAAS